MNDERTWMLKLKRQQGIQLAFFEVTSQWLKRKSKVVKEEWLMNENKTTKDYWTAKGCWTKVHSAKKDQRKILRKEVDLLEHQANQLSFVKKRLKNEMNIETLLWWKQTWWYTEKGRGHWRWKGAISSRI